MLFSMRACILGPSAPKSDFWRCLNLVLSTRISIFAAILFLAVFSSKPFADNGNPSAGLWQRSDESSTRVVEHDLWQALLDRYVDDTHLSGVNLFDYAAVSNEDRKILTQYIIDLEKSDPTTLSRAEQKAYWINFYNALTVKIVLENYPVDSIKKIGSLFNFGPWDNTLVEVNNSGLSLNDIEHGILRPNFQDPRIHYAVNCASYSCPNLSSKVFTADNTEQLLETAAKDYINHPRGVHVEGDDLILSSIFDWYAEDFGNDKQELISHIRSYAEPALADKLRSFDGDIDYGYDWKLNDTP